jgi:hypothetical protein
VASPSLVVQRSVGVVIRKTAQGSRTPQHACNAVGDTMAITASERGKSVS